MIAGFKKIWYFCVYPLPVYTNFLLLCMAFFIESVSCLFPIFALI